MVRNIILAFVLMAGLAPAFAQAPPPVPALPDTERRTTYSLTASTCNCAVGFQLYGDNTDFQNWIEVWVDGVQIPQAGNWNVTSPTGPLATIPRPITNAVLSFTSPQTGTVQIVGARRPRRVAQFTENRGVSARDLNQALTDIVAQNRETWDRAARTIQAPPGETLSVLSTMAQRAGQGACFDPNGNLVSCVAVPGSTFTPGNGITFSGVNPTSIAANLQAGSGIDISGSNPLVIGLKNNAKPYVMPGDYGITCDGTTDWHTELQTMITASAGKVIYIPPGPACITSVTLSLPANTTIVGGGREVSILKGTGAANPILLATNVSNVKLRDLWLQGSDSATSWTATNIGAVRFNQNAGAAASGGDLDIQHVKFSGFNTNYWVLVDARGSTYALANVTFSNNLVSSAAGDVPTDPVNANNSNTAFVTYSGTGGNGRIQNIAIKNNRIDASSLCVAINLFSNNYLYQIDGNQIYRPGQTSTSHCTNGLGATNAYGIIVYDLAADGNPPQDGQISNNRIVLPYSSGIYIAGDGDPSHSAIAYNDFRLLISGNLVDGQITDDDSVLPRASIAVNNASNIDIIGNRALNGFGGYAATAQFSGTISIVGNTCDTGAASVTSLVSCVKLVAAPGTANTAKYVVKANTLSMTQADSGGGSTVLAKSSTTARFNSIEVSENSVRGGWNGLDLNNQFVTNSLVVKGNLIGGKLLNVMAGIASLSGAPAVISGNVFDASDGNNGVGLDVHGSVVHMQANKFVNRTSGTNPMYRGDSACGTIMGTQFNNVIQTAQVYPGSLGTSNPSSCTLNYLDQVQNLTPGEAGGGGSKYVVDHWIHVDTSPGTTHVDQRMLTGN